MTINNTPLEQTECEIFAADMEELQIRGVDIIFTHHPYETFTKSPRIKARNKAMGVRSGYPDYTIIIGDELLYIEMKRQKGGQVTPEQKKWHARLKRAGHRVEVCKGRDEALKVIQGYL